MEVELVVRGCCLLWMMMMVDECVVGAAAATAADVHATAAADDTCSDVFHAAAVRVLPVSNQAHKASAAADQLVLCSDCTDPS